MTRISTPWPTADAMLRLDPGAITVLASLPTAGRSTLALNIAAHAAAHGHGSVYSSAEIGVSQQREKVLAARFGVDMRSKNITASEWEEMKHAVQSQMDSLPIIYRTRGSEQLPREAWNAGRAEAATVNTQPALWVLDTIEHFTAFATDGMAWQDSMHQVKRIASEQQIAVLLTYQAITSHEEERVALHHIPDEIRQAADTLVALERPGVYWKPLGDYTEAELISLDRPLNTVQFRLEAPLCRFVERETQR